MGVSGRLVRVQIACYHAGWEWELAVDRFAACVRDPAYDWLRKRRGWTILAPTAHAWVGRPERDEKNRTGQNPQEDESAPGPPHFHVRDPWAVARAAGLLWVLGLDPVALPHVPSPKVVKSQDPWTGNLLVIGRWEGWAAPWDPSYPFLRKIRELPRMTRFLDPFCLAIPCYRRILRRSDPSRVGALEWSESLPDIDVGVVSIHEIAGGALAIAAQGAGWHGTIGAVQALTHPDTFRKVVPSGMKLPLEFVVVTRVHHTSKAECGDVFAAHEVFVAKEIDEVSEKLLCLPPRSGSAPYVFRPVKDKVGLAPFKVCRLEGQVNRTEYGYKPVKLILDGVSVRCDWTQRKCEVPPENGDVHERLAKYFQGKRPPVAATPHFCFIDLVEFLDYLFENARVTGFPGADPDLRRLGFLRLDELVTRLQAVLAPELDPVKFGKIQDGKRRARARIRGKKDTRPPLTEKQAEELGLREIRKRLGQRLPSWVREIDAAFRKAEFGGEAKFDGGYVLWLIRDWTGRANGSFGHLWIGANVSAYGKPEFVPFDPRQELRNAP